MTATDFIVSQAKNTREGYVAASAAAASELVPSGSLVLGWEMANAHTSAVTISGVPLYEDPDVTNAARIGTTIAASGTERSNTAFEAASGLRFYSDSAGGTSTSVRVYTD